MGMLRGYEIPPSLMVDVSIGPAMLLWLLVG